LAKYSRNIWIMGKNPPVYRLQKKSWKFSKNLDRFPDNWPYCPVSSYAPGPPGPGAFP
jgi:hypothetical protein